MNGVEAVDDGAEDEGVAVDSCGMTRGADDGVADERGAAGAADAVERPGAVVTSYTGTVNVVVPGAVSGVGAGETVDGITGSTSKGSAAAARARANDVVDGADVPGTPPADFERDVVDGRRT